METKPEEDNCVSQQQHQVVIIPSEASIKSAQSTTAKPPSLSPAAPPDNPDNSKVVEQWRTLTRYVSYADMVFTFTVFVHGAILAASTGLAVYQSFQHEKFEEVKVSGPIVLFLSFNQLASHMWGLKMACKLYTAADPLTLLPEAILKAVSWREFQLFKIIVALIIGVVTTKNGLSLGSLNFLWIVIRIGFLYIVHKFILEMEKNVNVNDDVKKGKKNSASIRPVMVVTISEKISAVSPLK